jgi:hypothetical protein
VAVNPGPVTVAEHNTHNMRIATLNARSMRYKAPAISDFVFGKSLDIIGITETWLTSKETTAGLADITPSGYSFHQAPRRGKTGGGVGLFVSPAFKFLPITLPKQASFEAICGKITGSNSTGNKVCFNILNLYCPRKDSRFLDEFQDILAHLSSLPHDSIIMGDFNLHVDVPSNATTEFLETLSSFDLHQHVDFPTHILGHTLDLIITSTALKLKSVIPSDRFSDHFSVIAEVDAEVFTRTERKTVVFRNIRSIDTDAFQDDIRRSELIANPARNAADFAKQYHDTLAVILDRHAPLKQKKVSPKPVNPWMTPEILGAKRHRRYLERIWRKNPTALNRSRFTRQTHLCNRIMSKAKSAYFSDLIRDNSTDQRTLWGVFDKILHRRPAKFLPEFTSLSDLAKTFGSYFVDKISLIRSSFADVPSSETCLPARPESAKLLSFSPVSEDEIRKLILTSPTKSCDLDPIPTVLLKSCIDVLLTPITSLINMSLSEGKFPSAFKIAHVVPLLKKPSLCKETMKNYRPVSNLCFISKLLEKVVASRLKSHVDLSKLSNPFQSAYRKLHSTETALLKIHNDILMAMDKGRVTALVLIDLSAAFDTIDHSILTHRLENWFGISGLALHWLSSYLTDRSQRVKLDDCLSPNVSIPFGVPQGSVLGPLLFSLYTTPLSNVIENHSVPHQLYADDTQLYISFSANDSAESLHSLQSCLESVQNWMFLNKLKLNPDKTEFLLIGHEQQRKKYLSQFPIPLMGVDTKPAEKPARNLGVMFDNNFNFRSHVSQVCSSCYYHIRDMRRIRRHLSLDNAKSLASALVSSRLDYCNSLLFNIADKDMRRLQRVQNSLARVVTRSNLLAHSAPLRQSLHWLPVSFRIEFKINVLTFKTLSTGQPSYLYGVLNKATQSRSLRSNKGLKLFVPRVRTNMGKRAFSSCGPVLWNKLPLSLRSATSAVTFRKHLKTHLFGIAYPP